MKINNQQFLAQVVSDADDFDKEVAIQKLTTRRSDIDVGFTDKVQKMRTPQGKSIKAEQSVYKNRDSKRKFK